MIFESNTTMLGTLDIPMAEGYDCSTGVAQALIESAQNDMAMFRAMLEVDQREVMINRQTDGFVNESELVSLQEAAGKGIWQKIKDLFATLISKLKSIWNNFVAKLRGLYAKDATLVKKYKSQVLSKKNLGNMQCKYAKLKSGKGITDLFEGKDAAGTETNLANITGLYSDNEDIMRKNVYGKIYAPAKDAEDNKEFETKYHESFFDDAETGKFGDSGYSMVNIINYLESYDKNVSKLKSTFSKEESALNKLVKDADKNVSDYASGTKDAEGNTQVDETKLTTATNCYAAAQKYQEVYLLYNRCRINAITYLHKMLKSIFMKAVSINDKKLEESGIYADAIAEAAATEVETVIKGAIASEEFSQFNNASRNVKDGEVTDDYNALTYGPDCYTPSKSCVPTSGAVDSNINGKIGGKSEAAYDEPTWF